MLQNIELPDEFISTVYSVRVCSFSLSLSRAHMVRVLFDSLVGLLQKQKSRLLQSYCSRKLNYGLYFGGGCDKENFPECFGFDPKA